MAKQPSEMSVVAIAISVLDVVRFIHPYYSDLFSVWRYRCNVSYPVIGSLIPHEYENPNSNIQSIIWSS